MPAWSATEARRESSGTRRVAFALEPVPPFRLDLTAWALRRRPDNLVDRWDGRAYRRVLVVEDQPIQVAVVQTGPPDRPRLRVTATGLSLTASMKGEVTGVLEHLLGLRVDLTEFYRLAARDRKLDPLAERFRGVKPPRFPTLFETLGNAIACQQVTLSLGILLLNRLARRCGVAVPGPGEPAYAFPRPEKVATLPPDGLQPLGFSGQKSRAVIELARAVGEKRMDFARLSPLADEAALARLRELRGVGRWSAEYVLLRGLGRLHVFPGDDVGARNHLRRWLRRSESLDYEGVRRALRRWHPYAGLVYFHLLLTRLAETGYLT